MLRECISTSKFAFVAFALLHSSSAFAAEGEGRTTEPEEEDYTSTPFTQYGEFNERADEDADAKFFQSGRFFGVSLGLGMQGVTGNRGELWQGGFPMIDFRVHYWFDFNLALNLGFYQANHFYEAPTSIIEGGRSTVNMSRVGLDVRYYFEMQNVTAAIAWMNPNVSLGAGSFSKTETSTGTGIPATDGAFGISAGGGLEFVLSPRKTYFQIDSKVHLLNFTDTETSIFQPDPIALDDLTGMFYTVSGSLLFVW